MKIDSSFIQSIIPYSNEFIYRSVESLHVGRHIIVLQETQQKLVLSFDLLVVSRQDIRSSLKQKGSIFRVAVKLQSSLEDLCEIGKKVFAFQLLLDQGNAVIVEESGEGCEEIGRSEMGFAAADGLETDEDDLGVFQHSSLVAILDESVAEGFQNESKDRLTEITLQSDGKTCDDISSSLQA